MSSNLFFPFISNVFHREATEHPQNTPVPVYLVIPSRLSHGESESLSNEDIESFRSFFNTLPELERRTYRSVLSDIEERQRFLLEIQRQQEIVERKRQFKPISKEYLSKLPRFKFDKFLISEMKRKKFLYDDNCDTCSICFDNYCDSDSDSNGHKKTKKLLYCTCGHIYHEKCISEWLKSKNTCPLCKYEFPLDKHISHLHPKNNINDDRYSKRSKVLQRIDMIMFKVIIKIWNEWSIKSSRLKEYIQKIDGFVDELDKWKFRKGEENVRKKKRETMRRITYVQDMIENILATRKSCCDQS